MHLSTYKFQSTTHKQQGAVLFISLIFLLIMTVIGISSLRSSTMDERQAGNALDRQLAFQAAESALRAGERFIDNNTPTLDEDCTNGFCTNPREQDISNWQEDPTHPVWTDEAQTADVVLNGIRTTARFIIEDMCEVPVVGGGTPTERMFRITAFATGGTDASRVMLQSSYVLPNNYGSSPSCDCNDVSYCDGSCLDINCTP